MADYLKRCWYVAAHAHELSTDKLLARKLLGEELVLYRQADGRPVAFIDRCVHRLAPLSAGRLEGESLRCMYHGLLFEPSGRCIEVPGQERIGPNLKLRSFPVVERDKAIWIWMGEAELADEALIPDAHWQDDPAWRCLPGYLHYDRSNYVLVMDNLLDFSHLGYVHENTLGGGRVSAEVTPLIERFDWGLKISRLYRNTPLAPYLKNLATFDGLVDRWQIYEYRLAGNILTMDFGSAPAGSGALEGRPPPEALVFHTVQALTPETADSTHYFWSVANNFKLDDPGVTAEMHRQTTIAFAEDHAIIQAQAAVLAQHPNEKMVGIAADAALNQGRSLLNRMLAAEAGTPSPLQKAG
jgi:phenylpropionate dioxygenase-like ring-hydroxylating dioxygenase large terminal subunit